MNTLLHSLYRLSYVLHVDRVYLRIVKGDGGNIIPHLLHAQETIRLLCCH